MPTNLRVDDYYLIQPEFYFWKRRYNHDTGKPVPEDFEYNSGTNPWRLTPEEMRGMIEGL